MKRHRFTTTHVLPALTSAAVLAAASGAIAQEAAWLGPYGFVVKDVARGGRKDVKLVLQYDRVPSLLGLKAVLPRRFQRAFRLRRSSQRVVG